MFSSLSSSAPNGTFFDELNSKFQQNFVAFTCNDNQGKAKKCQKKELIHGVDVDEEAGSEAPETRSDLTTHIPAVYLSEDFLNTCFHLNDTITQLELHQSCLLVGT